MNGKAPASGLRRLRDRLPADWLGRVQLMFAVVAVVQAIPTVSALVQLKSSPIPPLIVLAVTVAFCLMMLVVGRLGPLAMAGYLLDVAAIGSVTLVHPDASFGVLLAGIFGRAGYGSNRQAAVRAVLYLAVTLGVDAMRPASTARPSTSDWRLQSTIICILVTTFTRVIIVFLQQLQQALRATEALAETGTELLAAVRLDQVRQLTGRCANTLVPNAWTSLTLLGDRPAQPPVGRGTARELRLVAKGRLLGVFTIVADGRLPGVVERTLQSLLTQAAAAVESIELRNQLSHDATHHPLTGLPNRTLFMSTLAGMAGDPASSELAIILVEVPAAAAQETLQAEVAHRIVRCLYPGEMAAQFDGSVFGLITTRGGSGADVAAVADQIRESVVASPAPDGTAVTCLIGSAYSERGDGQTPADRASTLLLKARSALETRRGGAVIRATGPAGRRTLGGQAVELSEAIATGQLSVSFRPVVTLVDDSIVFAAAEPEWPGRMEAADLVEEAGRDGLLPRLTQWLTVNACAIVSSRVPHEDPRGPAAARFQPRILVPIGAGHLSQSWLIDLVDHTLDTCGLAGSRLMLEVHEEDFLISPTSTVDNIRMLRGRGVSVALAGFGRGSLTLSDLHLTPVDTVVVDPSLLSLAGDQTQRMVRSIASTAHQLGRLVMADGVRNARQAELLRGAGCDTARGPYYDDTVGAHIAASLNGHLASASALGAPRN